MADKAVKIALPPVSGWTLGSGLEAYGGAIIRLNNGSDPFTDGVIAPQWINYDTQPTETGGQLDCSRTTTGRTGLLTGDYCTGDFIVSVDVASFVRNSGGSQCDGMLLVSTDANNYMELGFRETAAGAKQFVYTGVVNSVVKGATLSRTNTYGALKMVRNGAHLTMYYKEAAGSWVEWIDLPSYSSLATELAIYLNNAGSNVTCIFDNFLIERSGVYLTTSPEAEMSSWLALPAGTLNGTISLDIVENVLGGAGSIKYQYAVNNGAYNGSWVTKATMEAALRSTVISNTTNSLRIKIQFISSGTQAAEVAIASYVDETVTIPGAPDFPAESDVRFGVDFDTGAKTGTCAVPTAAQTAEGVAVDNTVGTRRDAPIAQVVDGILYGPNLTDFEGTFDVASSLRGLVYPFEVVDISPELEVVNL